MGMMGQNLTFLVGPDVSAAFFNAKDEELSQPEVYGFMKPVFGSNVVYDAPPKVLIRCAAVRSMRDPRIYKTSGPQGGSPKRNDPTLALLTSTSPIQLRLTLI